MIGRVSLVLGVLLATAAAARADLLADARQQFGTVPATAPTLANNPATPGRVELGRLLYFDPRLSASGLISCNTCHNLGLGGADLQQTSVGHGWQRGPRNAPTVLNAVLHASQFWDGRAADLAAQAKGPMQAGVEMNNTPDGVLATLRSLPEYVASFGRAFPGEADPVTFDNAARAIELFEATLVTPGARFDRYLAGETQALGDEERQGLAAFLETGCAMCHAGPTLGGRSYFKFGLVSAPPEEMRPPADKGRAKVTGDAGDDYVFKVPSLRNVALTAPYFHSGAAWELSEAVTLMARCQLGKELDPVQGRRLTAFLHTLTGQQPRVEYPLLPASTATTPRPRLER